MKKTTLLCAAIGLVITTSYAATLPFFGANTDSKVINTLIVTTPGGKTVLLDKVAIYISTRTKNACAGLVLRKVIVSDPPRFTIITGTGEKLMSATDIQEMNKYFNLQTTCLREDLTYRGTIYSTGDVELISEDGQYIASRPPQERIDFQ